MAAMRTIKDVLNENKGMGPGFDQLRLFLAIAVVLWHSSQLVVGNNKWIDPTPLGAAGHAILPMFFALSGFLVTGSALRAPFGVFILNRILRIVPALAVEICISALILGPILTTVPLAEYFSSKEFFLYFSNILGMARFYLPGVFKTNPDGGMVNGSLWTVPFEIRCYVFLSAVILLGFLRRRLWLLPVTLFFMLVASSPYFYQVAHDAIVFKLILVPVGNKSSLFAYFFCGSLLYTFRDRIPCDGRLFVISLVLYFGLPLTGDWLTTPVFDAVEFAQFLLLAYVTAYVGLLRLPRSKLLLDGDYSYGVYLYGYPIQQTVVFLFPEYRVWWFNFVVSIVLAMGAAMLSWHWIEKPILGLRRRFIKNEKPKAEGVAKMDPALERTG